jgi:hypothetical protein
MPAPGHAPHGKAAQMPQQHQQPAAAVASPITSSPLLGGPDLVVPGHVPSSMTAAGASPMDDVQVGRGGHCMWRPAPAVRVLAG